VPARSASAQRDTIRLTPPFMGGEGGTDPAFHIEGARLSFLLENPEVPCPFRNDF